MGSSGRYDLTASVPTGGGVFFNRTSAAGNSEIFHCNIDGSNPRQITANPLYQSWWCKISPDGTRILFMRAPAALSNYDSDFSQQSIWVANVDGTNPVQIVAQDWQGAPSYIFTPNWMPDGRTIVFAGGHTNTLIYTVPAEGGTPTAITVTGVTTGVTDTSPSPDGTKIVFCRASNVYVVSSSGGAATALTSDGATTPNFDPNYSPDGHTVVMLTEMVAPDGDHLIGQWALRTVDDAGGSITTILNDGNANSKGAWDQTGAYLYFHRFEYGTDTHFSLAKIRADGSGSVIRLTDGTVRDYMPDLLVPKGPRVPVDHGLQHLAGGNDAILWTRVHGGGLLASREAAGADNNGYTYVVTNDSQGVAPYQSNGSAWIQTAAGTVHAAAHLAGAADPIPWTTVHNGGALGSRPSAAAGNAGYTWLDTATGTPYLSSGSAWLQNGAGVVGTRTVIARSGTRVGVVNDTTETTLWTVTLTAAAADYVYPFQAAGDWINSSGSAVTQRWRLYLGATLLMDTSTFNANNNANRGRWTLRGSLYVPTTSTQYIDATLFFPTPSTVGWQVDAAFLTGGASGSVDMTTNPALKLTVTLGTAVSTADCYVDSYMVERIA